MMVTVTVLSSMIHVYSVGYMAEDPSIPRFMAYMSLFTFFHAGAGDGRQLRSAVLWLGRRRPDVLSADRLLVRPPLGQCCRDQGLHRQSDRRFRFRPGYIRRFCDLRLARLQHGLWRGAEGRRHDDGFSRLAGRSAVPRLHPSVYRRDGEIGADPAPYLAARCNGGPDPGFRPDPCGDNGDGGRVHGRPPVAALRIRPDCARRRRDHRRNHGDVRREHRHGAARHKEGRRLFDLQPARLHVPAASVSAYGAAIFHLFTHAFFKGLLFLCCGSVIHAMGGEQDMRRMEACGGRPRSPMQRCGSARSRSAQFLSFPATT